MTLPDEVLRKFIALYCKRSRGTVPEMNQASFDNAFDVKPGDKMYLPPNKRVALW